MAATNKADVFIDPNWKNKYPSLEEFYNDNYPDKYFDFEKYEFSIDPLESKQQIEAFSSQRKELEIKRVFKRAIIKIESYNPEYLKGINLDKVNAWLEKASFDQSSSIH
jgi:hypothetical protein